MDPIQALRAMFLCHGGTCYTGPHEEPVTALSHALQCGTPGRSCPGFGGCCRVGLSPASAHSLVLQGGPFTSAQAQAFIDLDYARDAVRRRVWDDKG